MLTIEIASPEIGRVRFEPQLTVQEKLLALNPEDQELVKQEMGRQLQRFTQLLTVAIAAGGEIAEDVFAQMDVAVIQLCRGHNREAHQDASRSTRGLTAHRK